MSSPASLGPEKKVSSGLTGTVLSCGAASRFFRHLGLGSGNSTALLSSLSSTQKKGTVCGLRLQVPRTVHEVALLGEDDGEDPAPDSSEAWTKTTLFFCPS